MSGSMGARAPTRVYVGPHVIIVMWMWGIGGHGNATVLFVPDMIFSFVRNVLIFNKK